MGLLALKARDQVQQLLRQRVVLGFGSLEQLLDGEGLRLSSLGLALGGSDVPHGVHPGGKSDLASVRGLHLAADPRHLARGYPGSLAGLRRDGELDLLRGVGPSKAERGPPLDDPAYILLSLTRSTCLSTYT